MKKIVSVGIAGFVVLSGMASATATAAAANPIETVPKSCNNITSETETATAGAVTGGPKKIGRKYLVTFYPRWFTYNQAGISPCNRLLGPRNVGPSYRTVVAINVDTVYTSATVDVSQEPVMVTVPESGTTYSILHLDGYGQVFKGIPKEPGLYALTTQGWTGELPAGATQVEMPYRTTVLIFRGDTYVNNEDKRAEAKEFRKTLKMATLSDYIADPSSGATKVVPSETFGTPFKTIADELLKLQPKKFLKQLQKAIAADTTQPKTPKQQALSDRFDELFAKKGAKEELAIGARKGHKALVNNYLDAKLPKSQWVHFNNMGNWQNNYSGYLDRSSITEYIQFGNNLSAAAYFQTFGDKKGVALDGSKGVYTLKLRKSQIPEVSRFWSLTAYTPDTIELVKNKDKKYAVASYTPGLKTAPDGSVTITMAKKQPKGTPTANWLPVPDGPFNVMLRAYGPEGNVASGDYTPPAVKLQR